MNCDCDKSKPNINTWGCGCNQMPEEPTTRRAGVKFCDVCDPCCAKKSNVKLCAYVVPTLEDGRYYTNSFVFAQDEDAVYYISDDRSEIPFGSRPKFINDFNPDTAKFKNSEVYDLKNKRAFAFGPDGTYMELAVKGDE